MHFIGIDAHKDTLVAAGVRQEVVEVPPPLTRSCSSSRAQPCGQTPGSRLPHHREPDGDRLPHRRQARLRPTHLKQRRARNGVVGAFCRSCRSTHARKASPALPGPPGRITWRTSSRIGPLSRVDGYPPMLPGSPVAYQTPPPNGTSIGGPLRNPRAAVTSYMRPHRARPPLSA